MEELYHIRKGRGPAKILLIHGNTGCTRWWDPCIEKLTDEFDVLAIDLKGYGQSPPCSPNVTLEEHAEDIYKLVRKIDFTPLVLVGHSLGGAVAMRFAAKYPELLSGMVLLSTARGIPPVNYWRLKMRLWLFQYRPILSFCLKKLMSRELEQNYFAELVDFSHKSLPSFIPNTRALEGRDFAADGASFAKPVLVVHGERDPLISAEEGNKLIAAYPCSKLVMIPEVGHCPQVEDTPGFVNAIRDFSRTPRQD